MCNLDNVLSVFVQELNFTDGALAANAQFFQVFTKFSISLSLRYQ